MVPIVGRATHIRTEEMPRNGIYPPLYSHHRGVCMNRMSRLLFICALLLVSQRAISQNQYNTWCFGQGYGIDFNQSTPSVFASSVYTVEGVASISNRWTGALLFYTDGVTVYNQQ